MASVNPAYTSNVNETEEYYTHKVERGTTQALPGAPLSEPGVGGLPGGDVMALKAGCRRPYIIVSLGDAVKAG